MHGAQPSANTAPSTGAPARPALGRHRDPRLALGPDAEEDQAHDDDDQPTQAHEQHAVLDERPAGRSDEDRAEHEDHGEADDEEQRTGHHPPAGLLGERLTGQAGRCSRGSRAPGAARTGWRTTPGPRSAATATASGSAPEVTVSPAASTAAVPAAGVTTRRRRRRRGRAGCWRWPAPLTRAAIRPCGVEHEGGGHGGCLALQGQDGDPGLVAQARVGDARLLRERGAARRVLAEVDAQELDRRLVGLQPGPGLLQGRGLGDARRAPRAPHVEHEHLAAGGRRCPTTSRRAGCRSSSTGVAALRRPGWSRRRRRRRRSPSGRRPWPAPRPSSGPASSRRAEQERSGRDTDGPPRGGSNRHAPAPGWAWSSSETAGSL